jgi:hypothetical protein
MSNATENASSSTTVEWVMKIGAVGAVSVAAYGVYNYWQRKQRRTSCSKSLPEDIQASPPPTISTTTTAPTKTIPSKLPYVSSPQIDEWRVYSGEHIEFKYPQYMYFTDNGSDNAQSPQLLYQCDRYTLFVGVDQLDSEWTTQDSADMLKQELLTSFILNEERSLTIAGKEAILLEFCDVNQVRYVCTIFVATENLSVILQLTYHPYDQDYSQVKQVVSHIADTLVIKN